MRSAARSGERRWRLASLKRAELRRLRQGAMTLALSLTLVFPRERVVLSSRTYAGFGPPRDQGAEFSRFCRALLLEAASAAPGARFVAGPPAIAGAIIAAAALLAVGALLVFLSALSAGAPGLGADLGARLLFVALLAACAWPWLADERRRRFDPRTVPSELLPPE